MQSAQTHQQSVRHATALLLALLVGGALGGCATNPDINPAKQLAELKKDRAKAEALYQRGLKTDSPKKKQKRFEQALELDSRLGPAHHNLGVVLFRQKQYYEAAQHLERAGQLMVDSGVPYANLAVLHGRVGHWDQALKFAKKALKRQPGHHLALRTKARALLETEAEFETIQQTLKQIAVKDPSKRWRQWATARAKAKRDAQPPWERES